MLLTFLQNVFAWVDALVTPFLGATDRSDTQLGNWLELITCVVGAMSLAAALMLGLRVLVLAGYRRVVRR